MDNIIEPNINFDFSKVTLAHPVGIQGGAYFTKIEYNKKPLYIQTTKSKTRQGIIKTGKKYYCDLMFDKNSEVIINWFENLESHCQKLIYEKRDLWFQSSLEENDIESAFNSTIRIYKSGKFYLLRTNIRNGKDDNPLVKLYDEDERIINIDEINCDNEIISILEIQGIKFTSRNFQIEIELKQSMVLKNEKIFDDFLIKTNKKSNHSLEISSINNINYFNNVENDKNTNILGNNFEIGNNLDNKNTILENNFENIKNETYNLEKDKDEIITKETSKDILEINDHKKEETNNDLDLQLDFEDLNDSFEEENVNELKEINEIDLDLEKNAETIILKKPNQVYFELYKEAKKKAKQAKKNAILAYLEVKNIKKTYMIDNMYESDSDFDAEIDEISESELEGL